MHTEGNNLPKVIQKSFELVIKERNPHLPVGNQQVMVKTGGLGGGVWNKPAEKQNLKISWKN